MENRATLMQKVGFPLCPYTVIGGSEFSSPSVKKRHLTPLHVVFSCSLFMWHFHVAASSSLESRKVLLSCVVPRSSLKHPSLFEVHKQKKVKIANTQQNRLCNCVEKPNQFRTFCLYKATTMPEIPGWQMQHVTVRVT